MHYDAVLILGKELRWDPERACRELRARAAAASIAVRLGARWVGTLEAHMRGQARSGSSLVTEMLLELGVPSEKIIARAECRSTRQEARGAARLLETYPSERLAVVTASYHQRRTKRYFGEVLESARFAVVTPEVFLYEASSKERDWIIAGTPGPETLRKEGRTELLFTALSHLTTVLPGGWRIEAGIAELLRRTE